MKNANVQTEVDAWYLYKILAEHEDDESIAKVFRQMSEIEQGHALAFAKKENINPENIMHPSVRAKIFHLIGRIFGYDYVLGVLMDTEKSISSAIISTKSKKKNRK